MKKILTLAPLIILLLISCNTNIKNSTAPPLRISENHRFLESGNNDPFFWLGDTGWLLFMKLNREETENYLETRRIQGFNVIQVMVLHSVGAVNVYGDTALVSGDVARPVTTVGGDPADPHQYDYWDHVDWVVGEAGKRGLYMALVPVWGSNVRAGNVTSDQAEGYGEWIASRYKNFGMFVSLKLLESQGGFPCVE